MPALPGRAERHGDHFIVCGDGPLAYRITQELTSRYDERVTVLLPSRQRNYGPQIGALSRVRVLEHPELSIQAFTDADVQSARALAVVWQDDVGNFHAGLRAQELNSALRVARAALIGAGLLAEDASADHLRQMLTRANASFRDGAPVSAAAAATIILDGCGPGPGGSWSARTPR
jgi:hypothetical protein